MHSFGFIQRPPPEILIAICSINAFPLHVWDSFLQASDYAFDSASQRVVQSIDQRVTQSIRDTINASHVCRYWRSILISTPEVWRHMVDPYDPFWSKIMMERSWPFGISFSIPSGKCMGYKKEADYRIEMDPVFQERLQEYQFLLLPNTKTEFPYLQEGELNFPMLEVLSVVDDCSPHYSLSLKFLSGTTTPNLKRLHLHHLRFYLHRTIPPLETLGQSLTHLHLSKTKFDYQKLLDCLKGLSQVLQNLVLNDAIRDCDHHPNELSCPVHLPRLEKFCLANRNSTAVAAKFLAALSFPESLSIFSVEFYSWILNPLLHRVLENVRDILSGMTLSSPLSRLEIDCQRGVSFYAHSSVTSIPLGVVAEREDVIHLPNPSFRMVVPLDYFGTPSRQTSVEQFYSVVSTSRAYCQDTCHLAIFGYSRKWEDRVIAQILRNGLSVKTLDQVHILLWEFLCRNDEDDDSGKSILPNLEELSFIPLSIKLIIDQADDENLIPDDQIDPEDISDHDANPTSWLLQPIDDSADNFDTFGDGQIDLQDDEDDKSYVYDSDSSGAIDIDCVDDFDVEDLTKFCRNHEKLRVVRFPGLDHDTLEELKNVMRPFAVEIRN